MSYFPETKAYLELCQKSMADIFFANTVNDLQPLTFFTKNIHSRCSIRS